MSCPPGMVLNPLTLRCVRADGRVARNLSRRGIIGEYEAYAPVIGPRRITQRAPRRAAAAVGYGFAPPPVPRAPALPEFGALFAAPPAPATEAPPKSRGVAIPELTGALPCPPGTTRNPRTRRCIKMTGRTFKRVFPPAAPNTGRADGRLDLAPAPAPAPAPIRPAPIRIPRPIPAARTYSEESIALPVGSAAAAPFGDRSSILEWADVNCVNSRDPLTNTDIAEAPLDALQGLVRTHDGQCTFAPALHSHVARIHKTGDVATLPADRSTHMTLDDFRALRDAMRRGEPSYKIPGRRRQPPPPTWRLYIASDRRSGPDFASIMYVDTTKGRITPYGVEYPPESVRVDLGFIPVSVPPGSRCTPKTVSEIIAHLATINKLLIPVAGGWKPVAGMPFKKSHWERDTAARLTRFCQDLAKVLASPI